MTLIFHMARTAEWDAAQSAGSYQGAEEDRVDGFIHFSTATQIKESAAKHRTSEPNLILVACNSDTLGENLKWAEARGGALFPHLYGDIPLNAVVWAEPLPLDAGGIHIFPDLG
jgi:uncharacterized protein (DUF952 family)